MPKCFFLTKKRSIQVCLIAVCDLFIHPFCSALLMFRLEYSAEQEKPPVTESASEGDVQNVWHLCLRYAQHPQCVLGCHGAPGILYHHARYSMCTGQRLSIRLLSVLTHTSYLSRAEKGSAEVCVCLNVCVCVSV